MFFLWNTDLTKLEEEDLHRLAGEARIIMSEAERLVSLLSSLAEGATHRDPNNLLKEVLKSMLKRLHAGDGLAKKVLREEIKREGAYSEHKTKFIRKVRGIK